MLLYSYFIRKYIHFVYAGNISPYTKFLASPSTLRDFGHSKSILQGKCFTIYQLHLILYKPLYLFLWNFTGILIKLQVSFTYIQVKVYGTFINICIQMSSTNLHLPNHPILPVLPWHIFLLLCIPQLEQTHEHPQCILPPN